MALLPTGWILFWPSRLQQEHFLGDMLPRHREHNPDLCNPGKRTRLGCEEPPEAVCIVYESEEGVKTIDIPCSQPSELAVLPRDPFASSRKQPRLDPVNATVLVRDSPNATQARVLLPERQFPRRGEAQGHVMRAAQLASVARTRAERKLRAGLSQNVQVFDALPFQEGTPPPARLREDTKLHLGKLNEMENSAHLRNTEGKTTREQFYVLVTRLERVAEAEERKASDWFPFAAPTPQPLDPLEWVKLRFPSEAIDTIAFVKPTASLARQARQSEVNRAWGSILTNATGKFTTGSRKDMLYVYGPPGAGKTALLKYIFERTDTDLELFTDEQREWIRSVKVLAITFNSPTTVVDFDLQMVDTKHMIFVPVVARLLFAQQSTADWDEFAAALAEALDNNTINRSQLRSMRWMLNVYRDRSDQHVVLLVDELLKLGDGMKKMGRTENEAEIAINQICDRLCASMDTKPFQVVFSSLSVKPMDLVKASNRTVTRLGLPLLNWNETQALFRSSVSLACFMDFKHLDASAQADIYARLARLSGGHPRTIEKMCSIFSSLAQTSRYSASAALQQTEHDIRTAFGEQLSNFPFGLLWAVLVGNKVLLRTQIPGAAHDFEFDDAIHHGYLITGATPARVLEEAAPRRGLLERPFRGGLSPIDATAPSPKIQPRVSELQLRTLLSIFAGTAVRGSCKVIFDNLRKIFHEADTLSGKKFEMMHMCWEIMRRNAIVEQGSWEVTTAIDYYGCTRYCGPLASTPLLLDSAPTEIVDFPEVAEWQPISKSFDECPPGPQTEGLLHRVWRARHADFPAMDFVIFVHALDGTTIPLVFQSKHSAKSSTPELGNATVVEAYEATKKIMKKAGWQPHEFILVVHAYDETMLDISYNKPTVATRSTNTAPQQIANIMLLDKPALDILYGSLAFTIEYAALRTQLEVDL